MARGAGVPAGNLSALRHGAYSGPAIARRRALRELELLGQAAEFLERRRRNGLYQRTENRILLSGVFTITVRSGVSMAEIREWPNS